MIWVGTSGYNYPEWKGSFYPLDLPASKMLPYYVERFSTVEINYSFYRLPSEKTVTDWERIGPDGFTFTLKAPRRITHDARLRDCQEIVEVFCARARMLGPKLGVLLFQLSPYFKKDIGVLSTFLEWVPSGLRAAFEFRHSSWLTDEVFAMLRAKNFALCITDSEKETTPLVATADYGYFRLRDEGYDEADIAQWGTTIMEHAATWKDIFVYFKHEEEGKGPELAQLLLNSLESQ